MDKCPGWWSPKARKRWINKVCSITVEGGNRIKFTRDPLNPDAKPAFLHPKR